ncbi:MAG: cytochrome c biogenesis protein [Acidobacteriota bacterium]
MRAGISTLLLILISLLMVGILAAIFGDTLLLPFTPYVPTEATMGIVQRIFYFHVPAAMVSFLAFFVTFCASGLYLFTKGLFWDNLASASTEVGVLFCTIVLVTGPIWARPVWGVWWTWEPRLTTTLVLWLLYVAYLLLRTYTENREQQARFSAVMGIVAFLDVPIVYFSVRWWRGVHPIVFGPQGGGLAPRMEHVFSLSILLFLLLYALLLWHRTHLAWLEDRIESLQPNRLQAGSR